MDAHQLLNHLGVAMGLPALAFDEQGCARLMFDGKLEVNLEHDSDTGLLQVYAVLGPVPARGREALYRSLLEANLFGGQTFGATLAIDGSQQEIVLCRSVAPEEISSPGFAALIEQFVAATESWQQRIGAGGGEAAAPAPGASAPAFFDPMRTGNFLRG
jgi:hypothetical protein